uniref:Uncharacterized protein n=1 Tax=Anguilla anguilla TaxID=7936 RepID=A0A0E9Q7D9_ANGAN
MADCFQLKSKLIIVKITVFSNCM